MSYVWLPLQFPESGRNRTRCVNETGADSDSSSNSDHSIADIYGHMDERGLEGAIPKWGDSIAWTKLHRSERYRMDRD